MRITIVFSTVIIAAGFGFISCNSGNEKATQEKEESSDAIKPHYGETEDDYYQADDIAGHIHVAHAHRSFNWEEHPSGKMEQHTNNLGFREDADFTEEGLSKKNIVLVIGDSHTDGVVYNKESYANQLEAMLNSDSLNPGGEHNTEVINTGVGYYGPQNYLGALKKYLYLKPQSVIVCAYIGNDFLDAIRIEAENGRMQVPKRTDAYYMKLWKVDEEAPGFTGQLMNQVKFFKTFPDFKEDALYHTQQSLKSIYELCAENNIEVLITLLPSKVAAEPETDAERIKKVKDILGFNKKDVDMNQRLGARLQSWLEEKDIPCLNLVDGMQTKEEELYWKKDYHLNHRGHKVVAELIFERLKSRAEATN